MSSPAERFAIAGIGTGVGKTLVSALFTERLGATYWKPIQAGGLAHTDTTEVCRLVSAGRPRFLPEAYSLRAAMSPDAAATREGVTICKDRLRLPDVEGPLVVEPAGGVLVPLAGGLLNIDLLKYWNLPVVLVSSYYLGSINHTLLTAEALKSRDVPLAGIVFNGERNSDSRAVILREIGLKCLLDLPELHRPVSPGQVKAYAARIDL